jgi:hypothetical protein
MEEALRPLLERSTSSRPNRCVCSLLHTFPGLHRDTGDLEGIALRRNGAKRTQKRSCRWNSTSWVSRNA